MKNFILLALFILPQLLLGQSLNRIETDFSLKEKDFLGNKKLSVGTVYYDKTVKQLIFRVSFPQKEVICVTDSAIYRFRNDSLLSKVNTPAMLQFSIFNLFLNGNLAYYGLQQSPYELTNVEKDSNMVISTWLPPENLLDRNGKIMLSQIDKNIFGLISYNPAGDIVSKQFFDDYSKSDGFEFPMKVVQYLNTENGEEIKVSTYRNLKINNYEHEGLYHYHIPTH